MKAVLSNYRQSPRKVRLIADLVRGRNVADARVLLANTPKRASEVIIKLIDSAVANAVHNDRYPEDALFIEEIRVDEGFTMKRIRPVSRGSAHPIRKRTSHVLLTLGSTEPAAAKKVAKKTAKKAASKKTAKKVAASAEKAASVKKAVKKTAKKATKKTAKKSAKKSTK